VMNLFLRLVPHCGALRFTDDKINWVGGFYSPNDISGLIRTKVVEFGTKVVSSMRLMRTLRFLEKVFNCS